MSVPMFSHFKMELVQFFTSAQRRKADEGVRIAHLNPFLFFDQRPPVYYKLDKAIAGILSATIQ